MKICESGENYLETILILQTQAPHVRCVDIASHLAFSKPSVSIAMKKLRENGHVAIDASGYITLTESGMAIASQMLERHELISSCLMRLGVSRATALDDACRIEHVISAESFDKIKEFMKGADKKDV